MQRNHPLMFEAMRLDGDRTVVVQIPDTEIQKHNNDGWDIYWCWNYCEPRRGKQNLKVIYSFYVDIDVPRRSTRKFEKQNILEKIKRSPLAPSTLIETYNGYQIYFDLDKPIEVTDPIAQADWFKEFVVTRLLPFFGGDKAAADAVRLLRAPFTRYWGLKAEKAPPSSEVAEVRLHWGNEAEYSLEVLKAAFPVAPVDKPVVRSSISLEAPRGSGTSLVDSLSSREWLGLFSGHPAFMGETVSFRQEGSNIRLFFNNHRSNSWLDPQGKIASTVGAGPTILQMLEWYGNPTAKAYELLKEMKRGNP